MKKIMVLILGFIFSIMTINAKTYYSDYSKYSDYLDDEVTSSDIVNVEKIKFYHAYKEEEYLEDFEDFSYEINDDSVIKYSDYVDDISLIDEKYKYDVCHVYTYNKRKNYDYFAIRNMGNKISFDEIYIYDKNKKEYILNASNSFQLAVGETYYIKLFNGDNDININDLVIGMTVPENLHNLIVTLGFDKNISLTNQNDIIFKTIRDNDNPRTYIFDDFSNLDDLYDDDVLVSSCNEEIDGRILSKKDYFRNYIVINKRKAIKKNYLDLYTNISSDEYKLDYNDYIYKFRYRTRDKVVIGDDIVIDKYDVNLKDYITYSTINIDDIKVTSDLDLYTNGVYKVNYILPFKTVTLDVVVDNKENYINLINEQEKYIEELQNKTDEAVYLVDKKNLEIKEVIKESENDKKELSEKLYTCKNKKISSENEEEVNDKNGNVTRYMSMIGVILFFLISIVISNIIGKRRIKKKN